MAKLTRKNAWNQNGTFDNLDLLWYARAVGVMQSRPLNDPSSWWFFAAIHGEYIAGQSTFPGWGFIPGPPQVPITPIPPQNIQDLYWNQCQHQSWYFAPWHRGYLVALEAQISTIIVSLGGPNTWALPYWNYFGPNNQYQIPPAFTQQSLPDGSPNPLFVKARYGPQNTGNIFIPIPPVSQQCQRNTIYTGSNTATPSPGYGGPESGFSNSGNVSGNLENNPHNMVHSYVGGFKTNTDYGLMSDPGIAALDPIFYLHHSNIDRMWASWNANGNSNPTDPNWLNGPAAIGEREFVMPVPLASQWVYTPADVTSLDLLNYEYDDLSTGINPPLVTKLNQRLSKLGANPGNTTQEENMDIGKKTELVGANEEPLQIKSSGARTTVKFATPAWNKVSESLIKASVSNLPDRVYLQVENVQGNMDSNILTVSVNQQHAGHVSLFGLRKASMKDSHHGGSGLTFLLDITDVIDKMHLDDALNAESLDVLILPDNEVPDEEKITVGRVSIYREGQL
jgi:tyrosinase